MKQFNSIFLLILAFASQNLQAKDKVIFACTTTNNKQVLVTEQNNRYRYSYGKINQPELVFDDDKKTAIDRSPVWDGYGRSIWKVLILQNGHYYYGLEVSMDRITEEHEISYGIGVEKSKTDSYKDAEYVNYIKCNPNKKVIDNLPDELGF